MYRDVHFKMINRPMPLLTSAYKCVYILTIVTAHFHVAIETLKRVDIYDPKKSLTRL